MYTDGGAEGLETGEMEVAEAHVADAEEGVVRLQCVYACMYGKCVW